MISKEQALTSNTFHWCASPSADKCYTWRRNGRTQTWKRDADRFRVPIKYGLYTYGAIVNGPLDKDMYVPSECPVCIHKGLAS